MCHILHHLQSGLAILHLVFLILNIFECQKEKIRARLKTEEGQKIYSKRKTTVEPVFGIIKRVIGFRQFLIRGLENIGIEWDLVTISYNISRMYALKKLSPAKM